jgi:hypothetical protein
MPVHPEERAYDAGADLSGDEPAPPSVFGETARGLLDNVRPTTIDTIISMAKAYAVLDLADAIRNS